MAKNETNEVKTAHLIAKDGNWFPGVSSYSAALEDIDSNSTGRSEEGTLIRHRTRDKVIKLSVTHKLDADKVAEISEKVGDETVELTVFCPASKDAVDRFVTDKFYVSKITTRLISLSGESWWEASYNAIQV